MSISGGDGDDGGRHGYDGTITGKKCPKGLYGTFCKVNFISLLVLLVFDISFSVEELVSYRFIMISPSESIHIMVPVCWAWTEM